MAQLENMFQWQTMSAEAVTIGDVTVTLRSRALTVRWSNGGFVWNRPVSVLVERDGETERIPIVDVTRIAQLGLLCFGFVLVVVTFLLSGRSRR